MFAEGRMPDVGKELTIDEGLAEEAKSIVALAFRNGPIEDVHAGIECPHCAGKSEYSHITQDEMKRIMKNAVNKVYALLWIRTHCPEVFLPTVKAGSLYTRSWDFPENSREEIEHLARFADRFSGIQKTDPVMPSRKRKAALGRSGRDKTRKR